MNKEDLLVFLESGTAAGLAKLNGLPQDLKRNDLVSFLNSDSDWYGQMELGTEGKRTQYFFITVPAFEEPVRFWTDSEDRIFMLDVENPFSKPLQEVQLAKIGKPDIKLDTYTGLLLLKEGEWVYASRGVTLYISQDSFNCFQMILFQPGTTDHYIKYLRPDLKTKRLRR